MSELTIEQIQNILGWSYPTALEFAKKNGEIRERKWYVPFNDVAAEVQNRVVTAQRMQSKLVQAGNGK